MRIRWTPAAAADLQAIHEYLKQHESERARPTIIELRQAIRQLMQFPHIGRPGRRQGTRELLHKRLPHIVVYRVTDETIEILHIYHPSQNMQ